MDYKKLGETILKEITSSIKLERGEDEYCEVELEERNKVTLSFTVGPLDRGPRLDHGGGDDGDEWQDDNQVSDLEEEYKIKNKHKTDAILAIVNSHLGEKWSLRTQFDYGEKGHVTYYVTATLK